MKIPLRRILRRARPVLWIAAAAAVVRGLMPPPPPATLRGVAQLLGEATGTSVAADGFVWEPSRGVLADAILGRRVLFLGRESPSAARDLFRAAVRVTLEGQPVSVQRAVNLSSSPFGDEQGLVGYAQHAAYVTVAFGAVQQVTLLDLRGARPPGDEGVIGALMGRLTNLQVTGSLDGLARTEITANTPARTATLRLDDEGLGVTIDAGRLRSSVSLETGAVSGAAQGREGMSALQVPQLSKPPILWAVDTVRSFTGPEPIAWLEENVFDARDFAKRIGYELFEDDSDGRANEIADQAAGPPPAPPTPPRKIGADGFAQDDSWPPTQLRSIWKQPEEAEGQWAPARHAFLKKNGVAGAKEQAPAYFYESYVRPDPKRPYSKVRLVAMDARQLQLGVEGGIEDPQPLTGARGEGRIPRDPKILYRAVGAFNGAFKTTHGEYGMMVNRRVLLPPKPGAATILVNADGRAGFGTWPESTAIPQDMLSFRQNLEPLVDKGIANPSQREQWGWHSHATGMLTHRSALCVTASGHMVYAWGPEVTGDTLGHALVQAGCVYAVHLDMNPRHTAFVYLDVRPGARNYDAKILTPAMEVLPERFIRWSPKDFFYLTLREVAPSVEGIEVQADAGTQPPPTWAPAVFRATLGGVQLRAFAPGRTSFLLRAGASATESGELALAAKDARRVLAALVTGSAPAAGGSGATALLSIGRDGTLELAPSGQVGRAAAADALPLPILAPQRRSQPGEKRPRAAICRAVDGYVWVAQASATSYDPLVRALQKVGCTLIASLDRGGRGAKVERAGSKQPPMDRYPTPAIYVLGGEMQPGAFAWGAGSGAPEVVAVDSKPRGSTADSAAQPARPR